eukprot:CAMPEP_0173178382 /NCGR_PEP_ID=MMETSP1141-20130122/5505_1 /TAXON_ID=483371 /ORGANISM="non described non described, Strain CCMP2298" /LENGTH=426 /DNA_ID=CAMNT_0014100867 /DNA_START=246 /DNA_END=1522 /DNA_ORIENTATION=+
MPSRPSVSSIPIGLILKNAFSKRTEEDEDMSELNGGVDIDMGVGEHTLGQSVGVGMGMGMGMGLGDMGQNARVNVRINNLGINHSFAPTYRMGNSSNSMDSGSTSNGSSRSSLHSSTHNLHNLHNLDPLGLSMSRGDSHLDDLRLDLDVDGGDVACIDPLAMFDFDFDIGTLPTPIKRQRNEYGDEGGYGEGGERAPVRYMHATIPKVPKNDIRRHLAAMFVNCLNSASLDCVQNFMNTFMTGSCHYIESSAHNPHYGMPAAVDVKGPQLMSHYLMGILVMFPDIVFRMLDSTVVTSKAWLGSKVVLTLDVDGTKLYHLNIDKWLPSRNALPWESESEGEMVFGCKRKYVQYGDYHMMPETYVKQVYDQALVIPQPQRLRATCTLTMFLDESSRMRYFTCNTVNSAQLGPSNPPPPPADGLGLGFT